MSVEEALRAAAMRAVARFLGEFYTEELPPMLGVERPAGRRGTRAATVLSTVGEVRYSRAYVPGGEAPFPLDEALGIVGGCTPPMASLLSRAGAMLQSYDAAGEMVTAASGVRVTGRRVHRLVSGVADAEAEWAARRPRDAAEHDVINIQADMTGLPLRREDLAGVAGRDGRPPRKRQVKVGAAFLQEANACGEVQRVPSSTTHVVQFSDWADFGEALYNEAVRRGYLRAKAAVFTSDGADWIWEMAGQRFGGAVQIVDFYHACEHLSALCGVVCPDTGGEEFGRLFGTRRDMLRRWGVDSTIRFFRNVARGHPRREEILAGLAYFERHRGRMQYRDFRRKGYFIGSGVVEGSCKCLVNQRCDLAGQRWHPESSQKVLRIRAAVLDGLHDAYWRERSTLKVEARTSA